MYTATAKIAFVYTFQPAVMQEYVQVLVYEIIEIIISATDLW